MGADPGESAAEVPASPAPEEPAPTSSPPDRQARGSDTGFVEGTLDIVLVDETRPTDEVLDRRGAVVAEASTSRTIPVRVAYPAITGGEGTEPAGSGFPLVVYAHGVASSGRGVPGYFDHLVAAGYVVAAPDFPETSGEGRNTDDYVEQPADVSFVLDHLVDRVNDPADDLYGLFDPERIAISGHSLGGLTAYALTAHDCCRDERFDAVIVHAPAQLFPAGELELSGLPILFVRGTVDETPGLDQIPDLFESAEGPAHLLTLIGEEHPAGLYGAPRYRRPTNQVVVAFLDSYLNGDDSSLREIEPVTGLYDWQTR